MKIFDHKVSFHISNNLLFLLMIKEDKYIFEEIVFQIWYREQSFKEFAQTCHRIQCSWHQPIPSCAFALCWTLDPSQVALQNPFLWSLSCFLCKVFIRIFCVRSQFVLEEINYQFLLFIKWWDIWVNFFFIHF